MFSSLPPIFSSFLGDFPFSQTPGNTHAAGGGGGDSSSAALVAFPVSIQPSAGGTGPGNLVLHAQNMGQPFLLTPSMDSRTNPLVSSQGYTPPSSTLPSGLSPNVKDFEQLKAQYERAQQLIHQQLLLSQMQSMLQQQTTKGSSVTQPSGSTATPSVIHTQPVGEVAQDMDSGIGTHDATEDTNRYINGSDVMMGSHREVRGHEGGEPLAKRSRVDTSPDSSVNPQIVHV